MSSELTELNDSQLLQEEEKLDTLNIETENQDSDKDEDDVDAIDVDDDEAEDDDADDDEADDDAIDVDDDDDLDEDIRDELDDKKSSVITSEDILHGDDDTTGEESEGDDDYDDDDSDDEYFQKFDSEVRKHHLTNFHPESFSNNYDEISKFTRVVRDNDGIIIDDLHKTVPFLTKYEYTRVLGIRAKQIDSGATPFIKVPENMIDSYLIAKKELEEKKVPFIIRRPIANGGSEYWNIQDLEVLVN